MIAALLHLAKLHFGSLQVCGQLLDLLLVQLTMLQLLHSLLKLLNRRYFALKFLLECTIFILDALHLFLQLLHGA